MWQRGSGFREGIVRSNLGSDHPYLTLIESLGYTFGFVLVILCRLQLFTENTITVVLPVLAEPTRNRFYRTARLWGIVLAAGGFTHVIAGSNEIFTLVLSGDMNIFTALIYHISPVLIGNILGGTGLFAMLAYGQVHEEM